MQHIPMSSKRQVGAAKVQGSRVYAESCDDLANCKFVPLAASMTATAVAPLP